MDERSDRARAALAVALVSFAAVGCTSSDDGQGGAGGASSTTAAVTSVGPNTSAATGTNVTGATTSTGGPAPCTAVFCEDFESGALDPSIWTHQEIDQGNAIAIESTQVAHGQHSVGFHAKGGSNFAAMYDENLPASLAKHYFGRLYYLATDFPSDNGGHSAYITSSNTLAGFPYQDHHLEVGSYYDTNGPIWQLTYWTGDGPEYIGAGGHIPKGAWTCIEWELNDAPDQIRVWVNGDGSNDGASFDDINGSSDLVGAFTTLGLGFRTWHPQGAPDIDIYIDDVVLDTKRVGCLP